MKAIRANETIDDAWLATVEAVTHEPHGQVPHVVTTVTRPVSDDLQKISSDLEFAEMLEERLLARNPGWQAVDTVAETIFPASLHRWDGPLWSPDLGDEDGEAPGDGAEDLFNAYLALLPLIRGAKANRDQWQDTYFGRLIDWTGTGYNQLGYWISALRAKRAARITTFKEVNFTLAGEGELSLGGQLRSSTDRSHLGGPCLVHLTISLHDSKLHLMANYRHWYLQTRAYGNLVGLSNLLRFVCQQTGYAPGELVVISGVANAQHGAPGGAGALRDLIADLQKVGLAQ